MPIGVRCGIAVGASVGIACGLPLGETVVPAQTTLAVTMLDSADPTPAGNQFNYTVSVQNTGSSVAANVLVTVTLDSSVAWVSSSGTGWSLGHSGQTVTASLATLASGATANLITITVTAGNSNASISSSAVTTCDNAATVNSSQGTTVTQPTTSVTMTDSADPVESSVNFSYSVIATNSGLSGVGTVNNASVVITCDSSTTFVSASGTGWSCNNSGHVVTCTRASMSVGASPTITVTVTAGASGGTISSSAAFSADNAATVNSGAQTTLVTVVTKDATSNIRLPQSAAEWQALGSRGWTAPTEMHLCQEASGNLADSIGTNTWTANGTPSYQQSVTGWSTKGVSLAQTANQCFQDADGTTGPHPATDSIAEIAYLKVTASGGTRVTMVYAAGNLCFSHLSTGKLFLSVQNQTATTGTYDYRDGNVHPYAFRYNRATRTVSVATDKEILTAVWNDITEGRHGYGSSASTPPASTLLYSARWQGEGAERVGAQMLVDLGWTLSYAVSTDTGTSQGTHLTDTVDGSRPMTLQVPAASRFDSKGGPYPLVMILGYYGRTGLLEQSDLGFGSPTNGATANLKDNGSGYLVLAPTGKTDHLGNQFYNADTACCDTDATGINDASYLMSLITQTIANYPVDTTKIWVIGSSNGAFMAQTLACANAGTITAFVALQGGMACNSSGTINQTCAPSQPVHALLYAHTNDPTYLYAGSFPTFNTPYTGTFASVTSNLNKWISNNGGGGSLQSAYDSIDFITNTAGSETSRQAVSNTPTNGAIELWSNTAAVHIPTYTASAPLTYLIGWLNAHPRT